MDDLYLSDLMLIVRLPLALIFFEWISVYIECIDR